jgi:hypothetical protein
MRLTPPKKIVWWISLILGAVGLIAMFVPGIGAYAFWFVLAGLILLLLGNAIKGL